MDQVPELDLTIMDCPECGQVAEIVDTQVLEPVDKTMGQIFMWRTQCLDKHIRDNYWYHVEACDDEMPGINTGDIPLDRGE